MTIGELELLPAVRKAPPDWLVIANGFSCREQIAQGTDRQGLHLAEILQMALHAGPTGVEGSYPERHLVHDREAEIRRSMKRTSLALVGAAGAGAALWRFFRNH